MRFVLVLATLLPAVVLVPDAATAQVHTPHLHVEGVGQPVTVQAAVHRGFAAYPAWALRALGAQVEPTPRGARIAFAGDTLHFQAGSPFFAAGGRVWQLLDPAYGEAGVLHLPRQFFADWLPGAYSDRVTYDDGRLSLRRQGAARPPVEAAPAPVAAEPAVRPARARLVVIDPGHGGPDNGRIGPGGMKEKDVVLDLSHRLARTLAARGYDVRMTRTTDTLINLAHRSKMANEWRGSRPGLFLSIHANGVSDGRVRGFETFFLSEARTEDERRVAEMENAAVAYETPDPVVGTGGDLDLILNSLRNDYFIRASHSLAGLVQDSFQTFHGGPNRGVKQAGFRVLVGAFMPAVLIEIGFISNRTEEQQLGTASFQDRMAAGIADAVDRFFEKQGDLWSDTSP